jgi:hypothetical protein
MRGTVDPAPRCRTAEAGEGDGLAKFAAEIEHGTSSRELQWTFAGVPGLPAGANSVLPLHRPSTSQISGEGVFLFAYPAARPA